MQLFDNLSYSFYFGSSHLFLPILGLTRSSHLVIMGLMAMKSIRIAKQINREEVADEDVEEQKVNIFLFLMEG